MLLVDPAMLESLQANTNPSPPAPTSQNIANRVIQETDNDINNILSSNMKPSEQVHFYNQSLQKREQYSNKTPDHVFHQNTIQPPKSQNTEEELDPMEQEIIETIPDKWKSKGAQLLKKMKRSGILGWNAHGNLVFKGEELPDTNVVDLVNDVVRRRKNNPPPGWNLFAQGMRETNVPQELIGNPDRYSNFNVEKDQFHTPSAEMTPQDRFGRKLEERLDNIQFPKRLDFETSPSDTTAKVKSKTVSKPKLQRQNAMLGRAVSEKPKLKRQNAMFGKSPMLKVKGQQDTTTELKWLQKR